MTCQEFDQIVAELAADTLTSARARIAALAHTAACEPCNDRWMAEKILDSGLSAVAESTRGQQTSVKVKQSLRAAFEAQREKVVAETVATNIVRLPVHKPAVRWQWTWSLAAAAAVIILAVLVYVWRNPQTSEKAASVATSSPTPAESKSLSETSVSQNDITPNLANAGNQRKAFAQKKLLRPNRPRAAQSRENDLAANYIPLSYGAAAVSEESLVVRVDVPRTTLIAMGLPLSLSAESGGELVKADLRVGLDGVPLAIRLVQK